MSHKPSIPQSLPTPPQFHSHPLPFSLSLPRANFDCNMIRALEDPSFFTIVSVAVCLTLYFARPATHVGYFTPYSFIPGLDIGRLFRAPWYHFNLLHIILTMLAYVPLMNAFEQSVGTLYACYTVAVVFVIVIALVQTGLAYALDAIFKSGFIHQVSGGMTAALFATFIYNADKSGQREVSVFGLFKVPIIWFPPIVWLVLMLLAPRVNAVFDAAGIICGYLLIGGRLEALIPAKDTLRNIENKLNLSSLPAYKGIPTSLGSIVEADDASYGAA